MSAKEQGTSVAAVDPFAYPPSRLAGWSDALSEAQQLLRSGPEGSLGVIAFMVHPDSAFYRLSPESSQRLHQEISHRLQDILRETDHLYAINQQEWLIVMPALRSSATLTLAMLRLRQQFDERRLVVDGLALHLPVSCGASVSPDNGEDALHLMQSARIARLHAEGRGNEGLLYDPAMEDLDERMQRFDHDLRAAFFGDNGLQLYLQPQIEAQSRRCVGAEALLRWRRRGADGGPGHWIPPPDVLAAIERLGLRPQFNRWLFNAAGRIGQQLARAGLDLRLSINLSANDLLDSEVPDLLELALGTWNVAPATIRLEITETSMVQESHAVSDVLKRLRALGTSLSIDDFGTGYSGMSNLQRMPVQEVKIDQRFIRDIVESPRDQEIAEAIIGLSHRLGLQVVAEGVETAAAADLLTTKGCEWLQGYLFSPALPLDDFLAW